MDNVKQEVVVITGASAGVGRATAIEFARHGARLGLVARGRERLEAAQREVERLGGRAVILVGDVADPDTVEQIARKTEEAFGPIDVWINNAMASVYSAIADMPEDEFKRVTDVTYLGYVYGTKAALRRMLPRDRGTIVQVGSALAYRSIPYQSAYCAAKHAIHGFTDSLRSELLADGSNVHVTMVQLPSMNTPQFAWVKSRLEQKAKPPAPIYEPAVAARAIHWAAHHRRREVYVGLTTSMGIKLNKLWPGFLDHYLVGRSFSQTGQPRDPNRPDNLWTPAPGKWAADGPYQADAESRSWQSRVSRNRGPVAAVAATLAAGAALWWWRNRSVPARYDRRPGRSRQAKLLPTAAASDRRDRSGGQLASRAGTPAAPPGHEIRVSR